MNTIPTSLLTTFRYSMFAVPLLASACMSPAPERLNSPPQGFSDDRSPVREYYTYHNDQGMMNDMSIADIHFIPHSSDLSGTGIARLERYSELLATSGGTINYDPSTTDESLINARLVTAKTFLAQVLPGAKEIAIETGETRGRGMSAKEAALAKAVAQQPEPRKNAYNLNVYMSKSDQ